MNLKCSPFQKKYQKATKLTLETNWSDLGTNGDLEIGGKSRFGSYIKIDCSLQGTINALWKRKYLPFDFRLKVLILCYSKYCYTLISHLELSQYRSRWEYQGKTKRQISKIEKKEIDDEFTFLGY